MEPELQTTQSATQTTQSATQSATQSEQQKQIETLLALLRQEPELSQRQVAERLEMNLNTVKYYFRKLQEQGRLRRVGSSRKGKWLVKK